MTDSAVILILLVYIIAREGVFLYSTHKMVNKIMSHNYHDYQQSTNPPTILGGNRPLVDPEEIPEDLGTLQGIGIL